MNGTAPQIVTIDCEYTRKRFAAAYLVHDGERALFIDNNTSHSVPLLLAALENAKLTPTQVEYVIITHVHLDHAGGSSALMQACPNAVLLGHPRATPHVIDPKRLIASAEAVYGKDPFEKLYGKIKPIPAHRVRAVDDGEIIGFGQTLLKFIFTRGHANHHMCVLLSDAYDLPPRIFTGDAFGLAYPDLQKNGLFVFPSTSPTDFDAFEAKKSVDLILNSGASQAYLTHYGLVTELSEAARQLHDMIDFSESLLAQASQMDPPPASAFFAGELQAQMNRLLKPHGLSLNGETELLLKMDLGLNALGLAHVARKRREKLQGGSIPLVSRH